MVKNRTPDKIWWHACGNAIQKLEYKSKIKKKDPKIYSLLVPTHSQLDECSKKDSQGFVLR